MAATDLTQEILKRADIIGAYAANSIEKITDYTTKFGSVAYNEVVDLARQYIIFGTVYNTMLIIASIIGMLIALFVFKGIVKKVTEKNAEGKQIMPTESEMTIVLIKTTFGIGVSITSIIVFSNHIRDTILVWAAPKIWLLQEVAQLVQQYKQ